MKLIDILVEELPKRGGWPDGVCEISTHASGRVFFDGRFAPRGFSLPMASDAWNKYKHQRSYTNAVKRDQYEAALAASKEPLTGTGVDGWIDWPGGECPVPEGALVDVRYRNSEKFPDTFGTIALAVGGYGATGRHWNHDGYPNDIIAYRLHQPQEAEQAKADDEADLNECIGQDATPVWNGEGQPPVDCMCERSWAGDEWQQCKILFTSNQLVVIKLKESGREDAYNIGDVTFRPLRSESDRKRDEAVKAIMLTGWCQSAAEEIYDLVAAGKVPGMKLDD